MSPNDPIAIRSTTEKDPYSNLPEVPISDDPELDQRATSNLQAASGLEVAGVGGIPTFSTSPTSGSVNFQRNQEVEHLNMTSAPAITDPPYSISAAPAALNSQGQTQDIDSVRQEYERVQVRKGRLQELLRLEDEEQRLRGQLQESGSQPIVPPTELPP
jgi:hypothetical protein